MSPAAAFALSPEDARPLSSREIAKLLCGVIGSIIAYDDVGHARASIPDVMEILIETPAGLAELDMVVDPDGMLSSAKNLRPTWGAALGATILSLRGWCKPSEITTALRWVSMNIEQICAFGGDVMTVN